ncbi:MAG: peptidyl-prolyl cis-trans isomerase, partial [Parachlamydiaceae bacterium]|nr:peptidyl-prolyl cis-trans isomerase [Parachlamydiaceae bacterium]
VLFGPNINSNFDNTGLTFDEASKMVLEDLTIRRMMYFRVQSKAINSVTPLVIRNYYETYAKENIRDNEWVYNVISIRHREPKLAEEVAKQAYNLLSVDKIPHTELACKLAEVWTSPRRAPTLTISEEFHNKEKELSDAFKSTLITLSSNSYSQPTAQKSRADNSTAYRIFYLKEMIPGGSMPFNELENKIKDILIEKAISKESDAYMTKLRQHYDVQETQLKEVLASDAPPFILK